MAQWQISQRSLQEIKEGEERDNDRIGERKEEKAASIIGEYASLVTFCISQLDVLC